MPAFVVEVDGQALTQDLAIGVSQVEVDLSLGAAGRFSFTVVDTYDQARSACSCRRTASRCWTC